MSDAKKAEPDGYVIANREGNFAKEFPSGITYVFTYKQDAEDQLSEMPDEKTYGWQVRPVWLSETPPVSKELMEWVERMRLCLGSNLIPFHYECDDCWYSCPKSGKCCDDKRDPNECTCGEDSRIAVVEAQFEALNKILPAQEGE